MNEHRKTDAWVVSNMAHIMVNIVFFTILIVVVYVKIGAYQVQNGAHQEKVERFQSRDACRALWQLEHRDVSVRYNRECEADDTRI